MARLRLAGAQGPIGLRPINLASLNVALRARGLWPNGLRPFNLATPKLLIGPTATWASPNVRALLRKAALSKAKQGLRPCISFAHLSVAKPLG